jgi:hypothetical protein
MSSVCGFVAVTAAFTVVDQRRAKRVAQVAYQTRERRACKAVNADQVGARDASSASVEQVVQAV